MTRALTTLFCLPLSEDLIGFSFLAVAVVLRKAIFSYDQLAYLSFNSNTRRNRSWILRKGDKEKLDKSSH